MHKRYHIPILILVCILSRLPQLLNPTIALDGDEAVYGLMTKHILAGKDFPIYFYGQNYGFTLFESLITIPFCYIWGTTTLTIKLPMLLMWSAAVVFFYKALLQVNKQNNLVPFIITLLLATSPAWAVWSIKARGGYQTAFLLNSIILYLIFNKRTAEKAFTYLLVGAMLVIIYQSQKLWLAGLLPILLYQIIISKPVRHGLAALIGIGIMYIIFYVIINAPAGHQPPVVTELTDAFRNIGRIPEYLTAYFKGKYYLSDVYPDNLFTAVSAYTYISLLIITIILAVKYGLKSTKLYGLCIASAIAIACVISTTTLARFLEPRYLLPLTGSLLFSIQLFTNHINLNKKHLIAGMATAAIGLIATVSLWNFQSGKISKTAIDEITTYLNQRNVSYVYTTYSILDYQIMFYSDEKIMARNEWLPGRYSEYFRIVDDAKLRGENYAIVGYPGDYQDMVLDMYVTNEFFISINPPEEEFSKVFKYLKDRQ